MNSPILQQLSIALNNRLKIIADHELRDQDPTMHLKKLQEVSESLEKLEASLKAERLHPKLQHYLERRSYHKALEYLQTKTFE